MCIIADTPKETNRNDQGSIKTFFFFFKEKLKKSVGFSLDNLQNCKILLQRGR